MSEWHTRRGRTANLWVRTRSDKLCLSLFICRKCLFLLSSSLLVSVWVHFHREQIPRNSSSAFEFTWGGSHCKSVWCNLHICRKRYILCSLCPPKRQLLEHFCVLSVSYWDNFCQYFSLPYVVLLSVCLQEMRTSFLCWAWGPWSPSSDSSPTAAERSDVAPSWLLAPWPSTVSLCHLCNTRTVFLKNQCLGSEFIVSPF